MCPHLAPLDRIIMGAGEALEAGSASDTPPPTGAEQNNSRGSGTPRRAKVRGRCGVERNDAARAKAAVG
jgi:hypothetical protein